MPLYPCPVGSSFRAIHTQNVLVLKPSGQISGQGSIGRYLKNRKRYIKKLFFIQKGTKSYMTMF